MDLLERRRMMMAASGGVWKTYTLSYTFTGVAGQEIDTGLKLYHFSAWQLTATFNGNVASSWGSSNTDFYPLSFQYVDRNNINREAIPHVQLMSGGVWVEGVGPYYQGGSGFNKTFTLTASWESGTDAVVSLSGPNISLSGTATAPDYRYITGGGSLVLFKKGGSSANYPTGTIDITIKYKE